MNLKYSVVPFLAFFSMSAFSEVTISGKYTNETANYTKEGANIGAGTGLGNLPAHDKSNFKNENILRLYIDGPVSEDSDSSFHVELQAMQDESAEVSGAKVHENEEYTQRDPLREAYIDTTYEDWSIRLGKQQVVWGTADGMKLLDMINPTDYTEMAQNQMEDSRIPVWMINAEKPLENGGNFQFVVSMPRENIFAGLDRNISTSVRDNETTQLATSFASSSWGTYGHTTATGFVATFDKTDASFNNATPGHAAGHPFIMQGVDSITGRYNGFVNIVPDMGSVASRFYNEFCQNPVLSCAGLQGATTSAAASGALLTTVGSFSNMTSSTLATNFASYQSIAAFAALGYDGAGVLYGFANSASGYDTNLMDATSSSAYGNSKDTVFEFMNNATFSTFDAFAGAKSQYVYNMPENEADLAMRYSNTTDDGINYSLNYAYAYDKNPIINLSWRNDAGDELTQTYVHTQYGTSSTYMTSIKLTDATGARYGGYGTSGTSAGDATLRFEQTVERAHNIGGSFDMAIDTAALGPVVIRGEALYQKDVYSPVMDLTALSIGDLPNALKMEKGDRFKYVLGVDITALTNMMVSLQFIQDRNLDYVDTSSTISGNSSISSLGRYTTDYATMHLSNGFNKAEKDKDFYSLYLSKPFGESGQHRWNNIFMYEENDGRWNRFDVEYTWDDNTVLTAEWNDYAGEKNTQFGQLDRSSNVQVGLKYSF